MAEVKPKTNLAKVAEGMKNAAPKVQAKAEMMGPPEPPKAEKPGWWDKHGAELAIGALPTLLGAAFGGYEGGATGAKVGLKGLSDLSKSREQDRKSAKELREEERKTEEFGMKKKDSESQRRLRLAQGEYYRARGDQQLAKERAKSIPKTFNDKIEGLGAEERKRFDNIRMGKSSINKMMKALGRGSNTFTMMGDNDFTMASAQWSEAIGRMQSGGAINTTELATFKSLIPTWADSKDIQIKKLQQMSQEMDRRAGSFGMTPTDIPEYYDPKAAAYLDSYAQGVDPEFVDQAVASQQMISPVKNVDEMSNEEMMIELGLVGK